MRSIWKGHIRFSLVTIPVRIYGAIETAEKISFNQLHKEDFGRIGYEKRCKKCSEVVKGDDIVKGYQYEPDQYVIVNDEDFEKIKLKSTKIIEIEGFVDQKDVHPTLYDTPYFAGPDGAVASKAYALLTETLANSGKLGIGRVVLRDRESIMLMSPEGPGLMLYKLRYPKEVRSIASVPELDGLEADKEQLKLAQTLVDSMTVNFEDIELSDRYKDALQEVIDAKVAGKEIVIVEEEERPVVDIMTALQESITQAKKQPMKKATGKRAKTAASGSKTSKKKKTG
ncbi:MAG: Ku protein [Rhodothermales bacterium]|nr:Ku protein [Rhodothermales bacterium]